MPAFRCVALVVAVCAAFSAKGIQANGLLYYEPFNYTPGSSLNGQNGGQGFTRAWSGDNYNTIASPGMTYTDADSKPLTTSGNRMVENQYYAFTDRSLTGLGDSGTSTWFSFIIQSYVGFDMGTVQFRDSLGAAENIYYMGRVNGSTKYRLVMRDVNAAQYVADNSNSVSVTQQVLFTGRIDSGTTDNVHIWIDPALYDGTPSDASANLVLTNVPHVPLNWLVLQNGNDTSGTTSIDEIRIGINYNSVVPEPAMLGLLPACAILLRRRRRLAPPTVSCR